MDGSSFSVDFIVSDANGNALIEAKLPNARQIFNTEWHEVGIQIMDNEASLFIDCTKVSTIAFELG